MNIWLIVLGGAVVSTIIMLALDWSGFRAAWLSLAIGVIVGVPIMIFTGNLSAVYGTTLFIMVVKSSLATMLATKGTNKSSMLYQRFR